MVSGNSLTQQLIDYVNDNNIDFYEKIDLQNFKHLARLIGLEQGADIDIIYPFIKDLDTVVELGSGYGRALKFLLQKGYAGHLIGVERSQKLLKLLNGKFAQQAEILHQDLKQLQLTCQPDAILWLWSGVLELSKSEQLESIKRFHALLRKDGLLILETPYKQIHKVGQKIHGKHLEFVTDWGKIDAYYTDEEEVEEYFKVCHFSEMHTVTYQTSTGYSRIFYILKK
ncbi:class I SAM-dependent methyltransferase [Rapidithrix thailandica]|uniref:Class I SAM-dependent methyltransferase n=1 Tax=Rapidithrix thailandica TaxID=413964 RepID=A0AAW9SAS8_9BACT